TKPDPKQYAASLRYDTSFELPLTNSKSLVGANTGNKLQTLYYAEDLGRHCRKIDREARLAVEETGTNMLYLVFGLLEYPDNPGSDKVFRAPLICLPVHVEKVEKGPYPTFSLAYTGEELADNLSLREKVKRDFGLTLPSFGEDDTLANYFNAIEEAIDNQPQWRLCRMMSLTLLSFANMLLVRDLDPDNWSVDDSNENPLLHHPIVRRVFEGGATAEDASYAKEYAIDDHELAHLPLIYDADSSQHSALIDVIEGKNLVIEGPPGTGKSQTITNLIAAALHMGKKVLFVSEKLAALEVVKARLAHAGLENFVLELHSNKANKKRVIEDIEKRKSFRPRAPSGLDSLLESLENKRKKLKAHADLLNGIHGNNQDLSVHKILWRAEKFRCRIGAAAEAVQTLTVGAAPTASTTRFHAMYDTLRYVAKNFDEIGSYDEKHPFWGFFPEEIRPGEDLEIQAILGESIEGFKDFAAAMANTAELLGGYQLNLSADSAKGLINVLTTLAPANPGDVAVDLLPKLFLEDNPHAVSPAQVIEDLQARFKELEQVRGLVVNRWAGATNAAAEQVQLAQQFNTGIAALNAGNTVCAALPKKLNAVVEAADNALRSIAGIAASAAKAGIPFDGTPEAIEKLRLVSSLAESAPDDALYLRHEGLRHPHAHDALVAAAKDLGELHARRSAVDSELYLDMTPSEADLKATILVLREGDAWYRMFQRRWRQAIGAHRKLQRNKEKKPAAARLAQIEELLAVIQRYERWRNNGELRVFSGPNFKDEDTPLSALIRLSAWVDHAVRHLQAGQVALNVFDPLTVGRGKLDQLRALKIDLESSFAVLAQFDVVQKREFPGAAAFENVISDDSWSRHLESAKQVTAPVSRLYGALASSLNVGSVLCADVLRVIKASHRLPGAIAELNNHEHGQELLGARFKGTLTDMEPIEGALAYGRLIKRAKLPRAVEALLISEASPQNHADLLRLTRAIQSGWEGADEFARKMGKFGKFELAQWAGESSMAQTEYTDRLVAKTQTAIANIDRLQVWCQYVAQR
ncbi:MAG: DUF4011 domain-containing protein, partial [Acidiferrobacterales bacterium]